MTPFSWPVVLASPTSTVEVTVDLPGPMPVGPLLPALRRRLGLPTDGEFHVDGRPVDPDAVVGLPPLLAGVTLRSTPTTEPEAPWVVDLLTGSAGGRSVALDRPLVVGRGPGSALPVDDPFVSRRHLGLRPGNPPRLRDLVSGNGIVVDGRATPDRRPREAVVVRLGDTVLRLRPRPTGRLHTVPDGQGRLRVHRPPTWPPPPPTALPPPPEPPSPHRRRPVPWATAITGLALGVGIALLTGMWLFLLLSVLGPVVMVMTAVSDRVSGRRSGRRARREYEQAVRRDQELVTGAVLEDRRRRWAEHPGPAAGVDRAERITTDLWTVPPDHPRRWQVMVGIAPDTAWIGRDHAPAVPDLPLLINLDRTGVLGLAGPEARPVLRAVLVELLTGHPPTALRLQVFSPDPTLTAALHPVPHHHTGQAHRRLVVLDDPEHPTGPADLRELWAAADRGDVLVLCWARTVDRLPTRCRAVADVQGGRIRVTRADPPSGPAARTATAGTGAVAGAGAVAGTGAAAGTGTAAGPGTAVEAGTTAGPPAVSTIRARRRARESAVAKADTAEDSGPASAGPVRATGDAVAGTGDGTAVTGLPVTADEDSFLRCTRALSRLLDPELADQVVPAAVRRSSLSPWPTDVAAVRRGWATPTTAAVLGTGPTGPVVLDLERDGPHLLVAGTTGSGKSELLRTLVSGLAISAPPTRTSLLLVDYKGGAAFADLLDLPHVVGCVTDLEPHLAARALTSLRATLRDREEGLRRCGAVDLQQWRERPEMGPAPPSLVIVVDEFATLAAELPEFLAGLLDVAQRGRSLGVHLVLATQRPAGVVSAAMKANITARLCLRVADPADSVDLVDVPDAALLPADRPGRACWRTGRGRTTVLQTARVGLPPADHVVLRDRVGTPPPDPSGPGSAPTDLETVLGLLRRAADGLPVPPRPWLPPLPCPLAPDGPHDRRWAVLDRPDQAAQVERGRPEGSLLLAGGPGSGRADAADRWLQLWLAEGAEVHWIGARRPVLPADHPALGSLVDDRDPQLVARLIHRLHDRLQQRLAAGATATSARPTLLRLDDWEQVATTLDLLDLGAGRTRLADLVGRGPTVGLYVAALGDARSVHHRVAGQFTDVLEFTGPARPGAARWGPDEAQVFTPVPGPPAPTAPADLRVRPLPGSVDPEQVGAGPPGTVVLGLGGDAAEPVGIDPRGLAGGFLISGPRRSGVSTALSVLAAGTAALGVPVLRAVATGAAPDHPVTAPIRTVSTADGGAALTGILQDHEGPLLLVVDEPDDIGPVAELLCRFLAVAGPGQLLALGCRLDRASRAHRGLLAETAAHRTGLMLQASGAEGAVLDVPLPRQRERPGPGRGHLVVTGQVLPVQVLSRPRGSVGPVRSVDPGEVSRSR